jgi:D-alanyl-D-alanine carboxypeptidase/D-alanyl-D-alanine-endopeptidase (penicillin-binding protein 4)
MDAAQFRARVERALATPSASKAAWGLLVADRDTGETLYSMNSDRFFAPASNAKIITTALAFSTLGPDYRYHTTLESRTSLNPDGRLTGDLILMGRGDPDISNRKFPYDSKVDFDGPVNKILAELADKAVASGLKEVDGDIVGDDSYFPYDPYPAGWTEGDFFFRFGAPVSAIAFNDNSFTVQMTPGAIAGAAATVQIEPPAAASTFGHDLVTVSPREKSEFSVVRQSGIDFLLLRGAIAVGHAPMRIDLAMSRPAETAAAELKALLEARGVRVMGGVGVQHAPAPQTAANGDPILPAAGLNLPSAVPPSILAEHISQPLAEIIRITNKTSQNLHAELLLRTVGREKLGLGSAAAGLKVERDFLKAVGIADGDVILSDGSGLARDDLVTPRAMVALLRYASHQSWGATFFSTLPVAGVDGTLENRMKNSPAAGFVEAKTGAEDHVRALSGYATTTHGEYLVFSMFENNSPLRGLDAITTLDDVSIAMVETLGSVAAPAARK